MKFRYLFFFLFILRSTSSAFGQDIAQLSIAMTSDKEIIITTQPACHKQYGLAYPITYQIDFPYGLSGLKVMEKHQSGESWFQIPEMVSGEMFNAIEAARFDYTIQRAYVSAAFSGESDSLFLKIVDASDSPVSITYQGISKYYDNRKAVVTISCDDWADWNFDYISPLMYMFRSRGLYLTVGIITAPENCSPATWHALQLELDSGYVEAASHSRTHPDTPYVDPVGEVQGSAQDINYNLALPPLFCNNGTGFNMSTPGLRRTAHTILRSTRCWALPIILRHASILMGAPTIRVNISMAILHSRTGTNQAIISTHSGQRLRSELPPGEAAIQV